MTRVDLLALARTALLAHRLRSALSIIGIVAGVATVITAFAIGEGAREQAMREIGSLGIRNIYVFPTDAAPYGLPIGAADAIHAVTGVDAVTPVRHASSEGLTVAGVLPSAQGILNLRVAEGRWLIDTDSRLQRRVAVVGADIAARRAPSSTIEIAGVPFVVVGVLASQSRSTGGKLDPAATVFVPLDAMPLKLGPADTGRSASAIIARTADGVDVEAAAARLRERMARAGTDIASISVVLPRALLAARIRSQRAFRIMLVAVGTLALFISGVGIMNIMLASVSERTAEIGVRRAFGATRRDILRQFAVEAVALCAAGGLAGVPLGLAASLIVASLGAWPISVSPVAVVIALAMASATGVVFGLYPARRAATITPVDAIRAGL